MVASYPGSPYPFTLKTDLVDKVLADHVNALQYEVAAIETTVGLNPHISTAPNPASSFNALVTTYASIGARLANIEIGVVSDAHSQYVRNSGGAVVTTTTNSVVPLTVAAKSGQTTDIVRITGPAGTPVYMNVDQNGVLYNNTQAIPLGRVASASTIVTNSPAAAGVETMLSVIANTFPVVSGRKYKTTIQMVVGDVVGADDTKNSLLTLRLHNGTTTGSQVFYLVTNAGGGKTISNSFGGNAVSFTFYLEGMSPGSRTLTASIQGGSFAQLQLMANVTAPAIMWTEDIGT